MSRELMSAIRRGDVNEVQRLIPLEDINLVQDIGLLARRTPLELAFFGYNIPIIQELINNGANFTDQAIVRILMNMRDDYGTLNSRMRHWHDITNVKL